MDGRRSWKEGSPPYDGSHRSWVEDGAPRWGGKEEPPLGREVDVFLGGVLPVVLPVVLTAGVGRRTLGREVGVFLEGWDG